MKKLFLLLTCFSLTIYAKEITTTLYSTDTLTPVGTVIFKDSSYGLLIFPDFKKLPPGMHGLHLHQHPNCNHQGMAAGDHYDPQNTKSHKGPYENGHLGDLPVLFVSNKGKANTPLLAPRLKTENLKNLTLMIHTGGDNYSDHPKLGGGGARIACGVIK